MADQLPILIVDGVSYYFDKRLKEVRNVDNPNDKIELHEVFVVLIGDYLSSKGKDEHEHN
jgi:hypothetical protein